jgi:hypothetical protein
MALNTKHTAALNRIISTAQKLIETIGKEDTTRPRRSRRSGKDAEKMKSDIKKARAKGVPAAELAKKYGVSSAYIYMIGT